VAECQHRLSVSFHRHPRSLVHTSILPLERTPGLALRVLHQFRLLPLVAARAEMQPLVVIPTLVLSQLFVLLVGLVRLPLTVTLLLVVRVVVQRVVRAVEVAVQVVTASLVETAGRTPPV